MSAEVLEAMEVAEKEGKPAAPAADVELAMCDCCGLTEECTPAYIARVRERHAGRWICGLCSEAVKDEISRSGRRISTEEALERHASFSKSFKSTSLPENLTEDPIAAMLQIVRRSLDSPRALQSNPSTPRRKDGRRRLSRSESCFPTLAG